MRAWVADTLATAFGFALGTGIISGLGAGLVLLPKFETSISPILRMGQVQRIFRNHDRVCFGLPLEKLATATLIRHSFTVTPPGSNTVLNLAVYPTDSNWKPLPDNRDLPTHEIGTKWTSYYCSEMPGALADMQDLKVQGVAIHQRHPFWDSTTTLPSFSVPALKDGKPLSR